MRFWSIILPNNAVWRYLAKGKSGIGFEGGVFATRKFGDEYATGVNVPVSTDIQTDSTATVELNKRINVCTHTAGTVTGNLPPVAGNLREIIVIKQGANNVTVTKDSGDAANIVKSAAGNGNTATVTTATEGRFLSDGTYWYRVS